MKQIGPHRVTALDILDAGVDELFSDGRKAAILYCDPPWGDQHVKFFATQARKDTGRPFRPISYEALIARLFDLVIRHVSGHVFIEIGLRWEDDMRARMHRIGLRNIERAGVVYGHKRHDNALLFGSFANGRAALSRVEGMSGATVAREAVAPLAERGGILFDPCCGLGLSAVAALRNGMEFRGNELNPVRLEKTIVKLRVPS